MTKRDQIGKSSPFDGRDWKTPPHYCQIKPVTVKIRYHRQTDGAAFSSLRLQEDGKEFALSQALQLVRKIHDRGSSYSFAGAGFGSERWTP